MLRKTKHILLSQLLGLGLLLLAAACTSTPGNIGVGLPDANANTGAYLVDTLTIKASTVLRDSIITSSSSSLLVGRYVDPQLGTITAKSYVSFGLNGTFALDQTMVADSLVLVIKPLPSAAISSTTAYSELNNPNTRYGDTTKTQTLVDVHRLNSFIASTARGYSSPKLTPMPIGSRVRAASSNDDLKKVIRRARPNLPSLRLRLNNAFRDELMASAKSRSITTQEQLDVLYPGLALLPDAADNAALVQFDATATTSGLILYYHDPIDPSTPLNYSFSTSTGRHFYQTELDASATVLAPLTTSLNPTSLQQLISTRTAQQVYIQGLLGLQTKLEIPYLTNLRNFGKNLIITSAVMTAEIPNNTSGAYTNLLPPPKLTVTTTDQGNHQGTTTIQGGVAYSTAVSSLAGISQPGYSWSVLNYCQAVLNNQTVNNGMLVNTATPLLPERVVLGGPNRSVNKVQLRLYLISND